jgi:hypothetical protein
MNNHLIRKPQRRPENLDRQVAENTARYCIKDAIQFALNQMEKHSISEFLFVQLAGGLGRTPKTNLSDVLKETTNAIYHSKQGENPQDGENFTMAIWKVFKVMNGKTAVELKEMLKMVDSTFIND